MRAWQVHLETLISADSSMAGKPIILNQVRSKRASP